MILVREAYTPLGKFEDRVINLNTFLQNIKVNFRRELVLSFSDSLRESVIVYANLSDVKISTSDINIVNRNTGMEIIIPMNTLAINNISEVGNAGSVDYIFPLKKNLKMFYRINVR